MRKKIFGLNVSQVDEMIMDMDSGFKAEKEYLKDELNKVIAENAILINRFQAKPEENFIIIDDELLKFGEERVHEIIRILNDQTEKDVFEMKRLSDERIGNMRRQIDEVDAEINLFIKTMESLQADYKDQKESVTVYKKKSANIEFEVPVKQKKNEAVDGPSNHSSDKGMSVTNNEIGEINTQYIVGKIAGEDVVDKKGNIIIKEGEKITTDSINRTQQEGELAKLIINMKTLEQENG